MRTCCSLYLIFNQYYQISSLIPWSIKSMCSITLHRPLWGHLVRPVGRRCGGLILQTESWLGFRRGAGGWWAGTNESMGSVWLGRCPYLFLQLALVVIVVGCHSLVKREFREGESNWLDKRERMTLWHFIAAIVAYSKRRLDNGAWRFKFTVATGQWFIPIPTLGD
jgi:hypothetical protein